MQLVEQERSLGLINNNYFPGKELMCIEKLQFYDLEIYICSTNSNSNDNLIHNSSATELCFLVTIEMGWDDYRLSWLSGNYEH